RRLAGGSVKKRRGSGPPALHRAERDAGDVTAAMSRQMDGRATHPTADIEHSLPGLDGGLRRQRVDEIDLGGTRRLVCRPQSVVDVPSPQQAIEESRQVVVKA